MASSEKGNGKPNYKAKQKNVSVYLGHKGDGHDELLALVTKRLGKSESQILRECYLAKMIAWGVVDPKTLQPIPEAVERLKNQARDDGLLPTVLNR